MFNFGLSWVSRPIDAFILVFECSCEMEHREGGLVGYVGQGQHHQGEVWTAAMQRYDDAGNRPIEAE